MLSRSVSLWLIGLSLIFIWRVWSIGGLEPSQSTSNDLESFANQFYPYREFLSDQIKIHFSGDQAALLAGMLIGEKADLSPEFKKALTNTSTIHMVVVSGQNLSLLAGFIMSLAGFIHRRYLIWVCLLSIISYSVLTGGQIPVVRAAIMTILGLIAQLVGRDRDTMWFIGVAGYLMLLYQPNWLFSISFQLSFLATFGVLVVAPLMEVLFKRLPELFRQDLAVSTSAQLMTWPIIAANFGQLSILGIISNVMVLWTVSLIMLFGSVGVLIASLFPGLENWILFIPKLLLVYFIYVVELFNQLSWTSLRVDKGNLWLWLGYYFLLVGIIFFISKRQSTTKSIDWESYARRGG